MLIVLQDLRLQNESSSQRICKLRDEVERLLDTTSTTFSVPRKVEKAIQVPEPPSYRGGLTTPPETPQNGRKDLETSSTVSCRATVDDAGGDKIESYRPLLDFDEGPAPQNVRASKYLLFIELM